jgi:endonuclease-8
VPEGDSIARLAARLRPKLEGHVVRRFEAPHVNGPGPKPGVTITKVESYGKYLMISFDDGFVLETHLRMTGRWDTYAPGERWRKPAHLARAIIEVDDVVAVCFAAPVVRIRREKRADGELDATKVGSGQLGPDLCRDDADLDEALRRISLVCEPDADIADVLLDQRVAAGVGNVFKSEVLWACKVNPLTPVRDIDDDTRRRLLETAAQQLRANLGRGPRTTVAGPPGSLAVYGRGRRQCRRCGTTIVWKRTGRDKRSTYWCPTCQPPPSD